MIFCDVLLKHFNQILAQDYINTDISWNKTNNNDIWYNPGDPVIRET